jgi:hypothetical protein
MIASGDARIAQCYFVNRTLNMGAAPKTRQLASSGPLMARPRRFWVAPLVVSLAFLVLAIKFFLTISEYAVNIFFSDQWLFNDAILFQKHSLWQMFTWQHGPHRQGAGALLAWLIEPVFRWNSRTESFVVGGIITLAAVCALWLKRRLYGNFSYSDVIIPLIFFSTLQYETLFVTANFAHGPLPLLFLVLYCLAWTFGPVRVRYSLVLAINFLTIYTGFGLLLGVITPIVLARDLSAQLQSKASEGIHLRVSALVIALASFLSFFIGYKNQPYADCFSPLRLHSPIHYAEYVALMFATFLGAFGVRNWPILCGVIAACAAAASLAWAALDLARRRGEQSTRLTVIVILTAYCLLFCFTAAYGRLCLGMYTAQSPRYVIYVGLGFFGLYLCLLNIPNRPVRRALLVIFGFSLLGTIRSADARGGMWHFRQLKQDWKTCYLTRGDLQFCNHSGKVDLWEPDTTSQEKLDFLKRTRQNLFADSN